MPTSVNGQTGDEITLHAEDFDLFGKRVTTFVIGSTAAGHTEGQVNYLCDGNGDQEKFNAAILALPEGGGKIVVLEGVYQLSSGIEINRPGITIEGIGAGTILKRMFLKDAGDGSGMINVGPMGTGVSIGELSFDGNVKSYNGTAVKNICIYATSTNVAILRNVFINCGGCIRLVNQGESCSTLVSENMMTAKDVGISVEGSAHVRICQNKLLSAAVGISIGSMAKFNDISGNALSGHGNKGMDLIGSGNSVSGNIVTNCGRGLNCAGTTNAMVGNICIDNVVGIYVGSVNSSAVGNMATRTGMQPANFTASQHTIRLSNTSSYNIVIGNQAPGKAIQDDGANNQLANNISVNPK